MNPIYAVANSSDVFSPGLLFYKDLIRRNVARAVEIAGGPARMRPHVKTHKTREIVRLELDAGVSKHKCATLAEAEMLADCGAGDVLPFGSLATPLKKESNSATLAGVARVRPVSCRAGHPVCFPHARPGGGFPCPPLLRL